MALVENERIKTDHKESLIFNRSNSRLSRLWATARRRGQGDRENCPGLSFAVSMSMQDPAIRILDMFAGRAAHAQDALTLHLLHELAVFVSSRLTRLVSAFGSGDHPESLDNRLPDWTTGHPSMSGELPVLAVD